jgi:hypothetical protein
MNCALDFKSNETSSLEKVDYSLILQVIYFIEKIKQSQGIDKLIKESKSTK